MNNYEIEPLTIFDELVDQAIPSFLEALAKCDLVQAPLFECDMPEKLAVFESVDVKRLEVTSIEDAITHLRPALKPHYRSELHPFPTRLVGFIQVTGDPADLKAAYDSALRINKLKSDFGTSLKELFPKMHQRTKFIRDQFKTMSTRSIHRQLIIGGDNVTRFALTWCTSNKKAVTVERKDIEELLKRHSFTNELTLNDAKKIIDQRMSHHERTVLIHVTEERAHILATMTTLVNGNKERSQHRPGLPLIIFGDQPVKPCTLADYQSDYVTAKNNRNAKYHYHMIFEPIGLLQRELSEQEWQKKNKRVTNEYFRQVGHRCGASRQRDCGSPILRRSLHRRT